MTTAPRSRYLDLPHGQVHVRGYLDEGEGPAVLLLHQNPLSMVTYESVLPVMSKYCRPIAIDTPGFGMSDPPPTSWSIPDYAVALQQVISVLGLQEPVLLGQHTGACICIETAYAAAPVAGLVLIGVPCVTPDEAAERLSSKLKYVVSQDGSHLSFLWNRMQDQYPGIDMHMATRHLADHLLSGPDQYLNAYRAVYEYPILDRLATLSSSKMPILLLSGSGDCIKQIHDSTAAYLPQAQNVTLESLTDFAMDEDPEAFSEPIECFVDQLQVGRA